MEYIYITPKSWSSGKNALNLVAFPSHLRLESTRSSANNSLPPHPEAKPSLTRLMRGSFAWVESLSVRNRYMK
jgi:hypothetical protein